MYLYNLTKSQKVIKNHLKNHKNYSKKSLIKISDFFTNSCGSLILLFLLNFTDFFSDFYWFFSEFYWTWTHLVIFGQKVHQINKIKMKRKKGVKILLVKRINISQNTQKETKTGIGSNLYVLVNHKKYVY